MLHPMNPILERIPHKTDQHNQPASMNTSTGSDTFYHTQKLKGEMGELIDHLQVEADCVSEQKAAAMFVTAAEVLKGLMKAFDDYETKNEADWEAE